MRLLVVGSLVSLLIAPAGAQALRPAGSDLSALLTYKGTFSQGEYYPSADELAVLRRVDALVAKALAGLASAPDWQVNETRDLKAREATGRISFAGAPARAGFMSGEYTVELELNLDSKAFADLMARNDKIQAENQRKAAALGNPDPSKLKQYMDAFQVVTSPVLTVHVETNPRDVSGYLDAKNTKLTIAGADFAFQTVPEEKGQRPVLTVGLGAIAKNTIDSGFYMKLKPSRDWSTQHFVEVSIEGDKDLALALTKKIDFAVLRQILN